MWLPDLKGKGLNIHFCEKFFTLYIALSASAPYQGSKIN
jgi:hypothetical protein